MGRACRVSSYYDKVQLLNYIRVFDGVYHEYGLLFYYLIFRIGKNVEPFLRFLSSPFLSAQISLSFYSHHFVSQLSILTFRYYRLLHPSFYSPPIHPSSVRERLEALGEGACKLFDKLVHLDPARRYGTYFYMDCTYVSSTHKIF